MKTALAQGRGLWKVAHRSTNRVEASGIDLGLRLPLLKMATFLIRPADKLHRINGDYCPQRLRTAPRCSVPPLAATALPALTRFAWKGGCGDGWGGGGTAVGDWTHNNSDRKRGQMLRRERRCRWASSRVMGLFWSPKRTSAGGLPGDVGGQGQWQIPCGCTAAAVG